MLHQEKQNEKTIFPVQRLVPAVEGKEKPQAVTFGGTIFQNKDKKEFRPMSRRSSFLYYCFTIDGVIEAEYHCCFGYRRIIC